MIKLYAWEIPFQCLISGTRQQELDQLKKIACINAVSAFMWVSAPLMVSSYLNNLFKYLTFVCW